MSETGPTRTSARRWVKWVLVGSLSANLLIVGSVVGLAVGGNRHAKPQLHKNAQPYLRALSHGDRREIGHSLRDHYRASGVDRRADRAGYDQMVALLSEPELDDVRVLAVLEDQRESLVGRFEVAQTVWFDRISAMSVEERQTYAHNLQDVLDNRGHWGLRDK